MTFLETVFLENESGRFLDLEGGSDQAPVQLRQNLHFEILEISKSSIRVRGKNVKTPYIQIPKLHTHLKKDFLFLVASTKLQEISEPKIDTFENHTGTFLHLHILYF